jgi:hypothetical protein
VNSFDGALTGREVIARVNRQARNRTAAAPRSPNVTGQLLGGLGVLEIGKITASRKRRNRCGSGDQRIILAQIDRLIAP